jgi:hypothetical protein
LGTAFDKTGWGYDPKLAFVRRGKQRRKIMIPTELISLVGGSATGFLFRYMAQKSQDQKELFQQLMQLTSKPLKIKIKQHKEYR